MVGSGVSVGEGGLPFRSTKVVTQCVVQLELISTVAVLSEVHLGALTKDNIASLVSCLQSSAAFAQAFNANRYLCLHLPLIGEISGLVCFVCVPLVSIWGRSPFYALPHGLGA
jgi:hypothetical protein